MIDRERSLTPSDDGLPFVTVIIPARDASATLGLVLEDLMAGPLERAHVVVVDDASTDGTAEVAIARSAGIRNLTVLRGPGRGPAAARNVGARASESEWLAFIDADVRVPPDWMSAGLAAIQDDHDVIEGIVEPRGGATNGLVRHTAMSKGGEQFVTANLWVRRDLFERVGGFDEAYTPHWREDTDLGWRLLEAGARSTTAPDLVIYHPFYRRSLRSLFREGARITGDTRLRKKFPDRARILQPRRLLRRSYAATAVLLAAAGLATAGLFVPALATLLLAEAAALASMVPAVAERGRTSIAEWLAFAGLALPLVVARTWWVARSNARMRTWFW